MRIHIGCSGWSYPSWQPGFYPAGLARSAFLGYYAERFSTVELNSLAYRLPAAEQFMRWREGVPDGFSFAPKLVVRSAADARRGIPRIALLGDALGPIRVVVTEPFDEATYDAVRETASDLPLAFDIRHESWSSVTGIVRVGDPLATPFTYLRMRDPPYSESELHALVTSLGTPSYVYFRHEIEPTAPAYAERAKELLAARS